MIDKFHFWGLLVKNYGNNVPGFATNLDNDDHQTITIFHQELGLAPSRDEVETLLDIQIGSERSHCRRFRCPTTALVVSTAW